MEIGFSFLSNGLIAIGVHVFFSNQHVFMLASGNLLCHGNETFPKHRGEPEIDNNWGISILSTLLYSPLFL